MAKRLAAPGETAGMREEGRSAIQLQSAPRTRKRKPALFSLALDYDIQQEFDVAIVGARTSEPFFVALASLGLAIFLARHASPVVDGALGAFRRYEPTPTRLDFALELASGRGLLRLARRRAGSTRTARPPTERAKTRRRTSRVTHSRWIAGGWSSARRSVPLAPSRVTKRRRQQ
jgi:hypothetical protein